MEHAEATPDSTPTAVGAGVCGSWRSTRAEGAAAFYFLLADWITSGRATIMRSRSNNATHN